MPARPIRCLAPLLLAGGALLSSGCLLIQLRPLGEPELRRGDLPSPAPTSGFTTP